MGSKGVAAGNLEDALRAQVEATQRIIADQRDTLGILQRQSGLGAISGADVAAQQAALAQAEATLPPLLKALAQQRNLLATLTGRFPDRNLVEQFTLADLKLPQALPLSLPSRLVEQRPDVRSARLRGRPARPGTWRHTLCLALARRARLPAGAAWPPPGTGHPLARQCRLVSGAGRRLGDPRRAGPCRHGRPATLSATRAAAT